MSQELLERISAGQLREKLPAFRVGDTLKIYTRIIEGDRERTQLFTGTVIARKGRGIQETVTLRRVSYGEGVERVFPLSSPRIAKIEVVTRGAVRRAKLYYLRERVGKQARIREKRD